MIQCVGSRNEKHPYCHAFAANKPLRMHWDQEAQPTNQGDHPYRDIRSYGFRERCIPKLDERV